MEFCGMKWVLGNGTCSFITWPHFQFSLISDCRCNVTSFLLLLPHAYRPYYDGLHPFHPYLVKYLLTAAGNIASVACSGILWGHTFFSASFQLTRLLGLAVCSPGTWALVLVSTSPAYLLSFQASRLCCGLSFFWRQRLPLDPDISEYGLKFEFRTHNGCALFYLGAQASIGSVVIPEGEGQRDQNSPMPPPWPDQPRSSLVLFFSISHHRTQRILPSLSVLSYIWVDYSSFFKITSLAFNVFFYTFL